MVKPKSRLPGIPLADKASLKGSRHRRGQLLRKMHALSVYTADTIVTDQVNIPPGSRKLVSHAHPFNLDENFISCFQSIVRFTIPYNGISGSVFTRSARQIDLPVLLHGHKAGSHGR